MSVQPSPGDWVVAWDEDNDGRQVESRVGALMAVDTISGDQMPYLVAEHGAPRWTTKELAGYDVATSVHEAGHCYGHWWECVRPATPAEIASTVLDQEDGL